ncbi:EAL and GGDEF domain-containing protein [Rhabdochromatium marinum]|uniref:sensor domain-containing protein n=1 Tax=Rhabdochromatium marinum TaxID=48729 RepID=UPI001908D291|nr:EAL domain-containing protein [Rhabdochromatium marinum]MBK1649157.1 diguanylate cyclase [Rhabdochromatium marinum]
MMESTASAASSSQNHSSSIDCVAIWQQMIADLIEAVLVVSPLERRVVAANGAAARLFAIDSQQLIGRPIIELVATPEDVFFWEGITAGQSPTLFSETLVRRPDGAVVTVMRRVSSVRCCQQAMHYLVAMTDQSERQAVETELEKLVAELRATLESTADGILVTDLQGGIRSFNQRFAELWRLPDALLTERNDAGIYDWMAHMVQESEAYRARILTINEDPLLEATEIIALSQDRVLERVTLPQFARGNPIGRVYSFRDITQRLVDEKRLKLASRVFDASLDAILITDPDLMIEAVNPVCTQSSGFSTKELIGQPLNDILPLWHDRDSGAAVSRALAQEGYWQGEHVQQCKGGHSIPCLVSVVRVPDAHGQPANYVSFAKDLSEAVAARQRIEQLAYNDVLTGLPNRARLNERIEFAINVARREDSHFAVVFIDLDRFKQINDSLGHLFGDQVLIEVAQRITGCLRQVDTTARLGGDEFVLLLHRTDGYGAECTARRLLEVMSRPFEINGMDFSLGCSIGLAIYPEDGETLDDLIKNADSAMYHVKERGRGDFGFYQRQMNLDLLTRVKIEHALREALGQQRIHLAYQPQIDLHTGQVIGAEALLRWTDPVMGVVSPGQFIPIAEETGLIIPLGAWVLHEAIRQGEQWNARGFNLTMAINVSALQFRQAGFVESLIDILKNSTLPPEQIELELTESILIQHADDTLLRLKALDELGIQLAIDDFGTGYSSLGYLKRFPIHRLKIDQSFVRDIPEDESDAAIATAVINLAHSLKLRVIAEGVENASQREFLLAAGCDECQGYLYAPALAPADFEHLLETWESGTQDTGADTGH